MYLFTIFQLGNILCVKNTAPRIFETSAVRDIKMAL